MVRVILLTLVFAAVCSFLEIEAKTLTKRSKNASPTPVQYGPQRPSSMRRSTSSGEKDSSGVIVFPETQEVEDDPPLDRPPPCANGLDFCEEVDNYPKNHVANLIGQEVSMFRGFFEIPSIIENRIDPLGVLESLCTSKDEIQFPKKAKNKDNLYQYIVNVDDYKQGVRFELCQNEGQECKFASSFPAGYTTECRQKHIYKRLLAVNSSQVFPDSFLFPSCCSCLYKSPTSVSARMAEPSELKTKKLKSSK